MKPISRSEKSDNSTARKRNNGREAHSKQRQQLKTAGICKIEIYLSKEQKPAARGYFNFHGFPTSPSKAIESTQSDTMARKRAATLKQYVAQTSAQDQPATDSHNPQPPKHDHNPPKSQSVEDHKDQLFLFD